MGGFNQDALGATGGQNPFDISSQALSQSAQGMQTGLNPFAAPGVAQGMSTTADVAAPGTMLRTMNQYVNPYRESVIDQALGRIRDRRNDDLNMVRGQANQASAYGGARQGIVEAQLMEDYGREEDEVATRMLQQGFDTRANLALQNLGQRAQAGQALTQAGFTGGQQAVGAAQGLGNLAQGAFGLGQNLLRQQQQAGQAQRGLAQQVLDLASGQYETYQNFPLQSLSSAISGIQGNPLAAAQTQTGRSQYNPGMFDYLSMGAGVMGAAK